MSIKLVVSDLDETMVIRHTDLSEHAKWCIRQLQKKGAKFVVASGRPLCQILPHLKAWGIKADIIIAFNGAEVYFVKEKKKYTYYTMKAEWMKEVIDLMRPFDLNLNIVANDTNYFSKDVSEEYKQACRKYNQGCVIEKEEFFYQENPKIMLRLNPDSNMEEIERFISEHPSENYIGFKTGPTLVEFTNKNVSKGQALHEICKLTGIDISETVGLGDTSNDNDLIKEAGIGVCMLNGSEDTKAIADVITEKTCDDDGWADFIDNHILAMC